jgi:hypothetical protein
VNIKHNSSHDFAANFYISTVVTLDLATHSMEFLDLIYLAIMSILAIFVAVSSVVFVFLQQRWSLAGHGDAQKEKAVLQRLPVTLETLLGEHEPGDIRRTGWGPFTSHNLMIWWPIWTQLRSSRSRLQQSRRRSLHRRRSLLGRSLEDDCCW